MFCIFGLWPSLQQTDTEQPVTHNIERLDESGLLGLNVIHMLHCQRKYLTIINRLHRVTLIRHFDARKQRRVG